MARGYGGVWNHIDPFSGVAVSALTSDVISTRGAFDVTVSFYTTSGVTNELQWQVSNATAEHFRGATIPEASWSVWTTFGTAGTGYSPSKASFFDPPLGFRWARIVREVSAASFTVDIARLER